MSEQSKVSIAAQAPTPAKQPSSVTEQVERKDPSPRFADGADYGTHLKHSDPTRKYVLINPNDQAMGIEFYEELGYTIERSRPQGPKFFAGKTCKDGDVITFRGHVLMSIDKKTHEELRENGAPGAGFGAKHWSKREASLLASTDRRGKGIVDISDIPGSKFMHVANTSKVGIDHG